MNVGRSSIEMNKSSQFFALLLRVQFSLFAKCARPPPGSKRKIMAIFGNSPVKREGNFLKRELKLDLLVLVLLLLLLEIGAREDIISLFINFVKNRSYYLLAARTRELAAISSFAIATND